MRWREEDVGRVLIALTLGTGATWHPETEGKIRVATFEPSLAQFD